MSMSRLYRVSERKSLLSVLSCGITHIIVKCQAGNTQRFFSLLLAMLDTD